MSPLSCIEAIARMCWVALAIALVGCGGGNTDTSRAQMGSDSMTIDLHRTSLGISPAGVDASGPIVGIGSKCLDNQGNRLVNQNPIQLYGCNNTDAQKWSMMSDGSIQLQGFCLDVKYSGVTPQTPVWLYACNGSGAQKWRAQPDGSLVNPQSGLCLDDQYSGTNDGNKIWIYTCNGSTAQKWNVPAASSVPSPKSGFVTRSGQKLLLDGKPYRFTGINIYNANSVNNYWYTLGNGSGFDTALTDVGSGKSVVRGWFGQWQLKPKNDTVDWSIFDHTLAVAKAHGYKVVVTLADQDGSWDDGIKKTLESGWYQSGYKTVVSPVVSTWGARNQWTYKDYVGQVVSRYKDDPTVLIWQLTNEAEPKSISGGCTPAQDDAGAVALRSFSDDMGAYIKSIDSNHLLTLGTIGTGQCGTSGTRYKDVYASPYLDLTEMHDYVSDEDIISDPYNGMALRLQQSRELNKPLFVGEIGIDPSQVGGLQARANRLSAKLAAQFKAGVVGEVAWEWRNGGQTGGDSYVFGPNDPMLNSLRLSNY